MQGLDEGLAPTLLRRVESQEFARLEFSLIGGPDRAAFDALAVDWEGLNATMAQPRFHRTRLVVHVPPSATSHAPLLGEAEGVIDLDEPIERPPLVAREDLDGEGSGRGDDTEYVKQRLVELLHDTAARNMLLVD